MSIFSLAVAFRHPRFPITAAECQDAISTWPDLLGTVLSPANIGLQFTELHSTVFRYQTLLLTCELSELTL